MSIEVQTTQNVTIDYEPAGLGYRMLAYILDWIFIAGWLLGWTAILYIILGGRFMDYISDSTIAIVCISTLIFGPVLFYDLLFEAFNYGQTPAKKIFKIRVINVDGSTPSIGGYLIRWLFRLVDIWLFNGIVAIISIVLTKNSQRLGDVIGSTTIISLKMNYNTELNAFGLDFHEDYKVTYYDVLDKLSDKDIQTAISIVDDNEYYIERLTIRIKQITGYTYDGYDSVFLKKIISDYNYLALQQQ